MILPFYKFNSKVCFSFKNSNYKIRLFSSPGYNSSTSSLNGDNPDDPTLVQFKRLSIVKEESLGNGRASSLEDVSARIEPRTLHNGGHVVPSLSSAISEEIKRLGFFFSHDFITCDQFHYCVE